MEITEHISALGEVYSAIPCKYKNNEALNNGQRAWFDSRKFRFPVELSVLGDFFSLRYGFEQN